MKRFLATVLAFGAAAILWLPCLHLFFRQDVDQYFADSGIPPRARAIANAHLELWTRPELRARELARMRQSNAEWDFMGRTFLVLSLANMALREPAGKAAYLEVMDAIIDETIRLEKEHGIYYFLMDYARCGSFVNKNRRSVFEDGEIALMIASRRMVEEKPEYKPMLAERIGHIIETIGQGPVMMGESYPDECWMFCNSVAVGAVRMADLLDGTDHSEFIGKWLRTARERHVDRDSGLLISSCTVDGVPIDGPEGSSIWMTVHMLQLLDPEFAADQYAKARAALRGKALGFGYAREWPGAWQGQKEADIDSGPVIPLFEISAGSSGLAFLGAASFNDREFLRELLTSLNYGGFPIEKKGKLRFAASNQVGDAVLLYSMVQGPLWRKTRLISNVEHRM